MSLITLGTFYLQQPIPLGLSQQGGLCQPRRHGRSKLDHMLCTDFVLVTYFAENFHNSLTGPRHRHQLIHGLQKQLPQLEQIHMHHRCSGEPAYPFGRVSNKDVPNSQRHQVEVCDLPPSLPLVAKLSAPH